jgi:hypothetical protein
MKNEIISWLDAVLHACNSRYSGGNDREDYALKPTGAKVSKTPSQPIKLGMVAIPLIPAMWKA